MKQKILISANAELQKRFIKILDTSFSVQISKGLLPCTKMTGTLVITSKYFNMSLSENVMPRRRVSDPYSVQREIVITWRDRLVKQGTAEVDNFILSSTDPEYFMRAVKSTLDERIEKCIESPLW